MIAPSTFAELASGRRRGPAAAAARACLRAAEVPYTLAVRWRNRRYDRGAARVHRVAAAVVSVGNLTLGGTGKTPLVEWIARWFLAHGVRVAIVSRGYGAGRRRRNDEALELESRLPDVPHVQAPDRAAAARQAIEQFAAQAILLDDGFQHRRLARDLDIVLLDALAPLGYGHVFPRGLLREPATELRRADCAVLSRADMLEAPARAAIRDQVRRLAPAAAWAEVAHRPLGLQSATGRPEGARSLAGRPVAAFCGTGQPAAFWRTLESLGCRIAARREFPDHHAYTGNDLDELARWADAADCAAVLTTHKDLVKIGRDRLGQRPLWALLIGVEFLAGQAEFAALLAPLVRSANHAGGGHA